MKLREVFKQKIKKMNNFLFQKNKFEANYFEVILMLGITVGICLSVSSFINQNKTKKFVEDQTVKLETIIENNTKVVKSINGDNQLAVIEDLKNRLNQLTTSQPISTSSPEPTTTMPTNEPVLGAETTIYEGVLEVNSVLNANVYEKPILGSAIINTVPQGSLLFYTKKENNWYQVDLVDQNKKGWVAEESVKEIKTN